MEGNVGGYTAWALTDFECLVPSQFAPLDHDCSKIGSIPGYQIAESDHPNEPQEVDVV